MKKLLSLFCVLTLCTALFAGCASSNRDSGSGDVPTADPVNVRVAALKGPTAMGMVQFMDQVDSGVLAVKTIPVASFIILVLILFSSRSLAALISFLMVLPIIYTNVLAGIEAADRQLLEMAEVFLIPVGRRIRYIYLPQVIPFFRSGCMVALGLCWKSGIAAEVIGTPSGSIGEHLQQAKIYLDMPDLFAWTLVIVLVSLAFEKTVLALLSWTAKRLERM